MSSNATHQTSDPLQAAVARTQLALQQAGIRRTPLTSKLLQRPPFRYLHDLVAELLLHARPEFAPGLFTEAELDAAQVAQDKEAKCAFLQKLIDHVDAQSNGQAVRARPAKIVAGLDAEDTNQLLQLLAEMAVRSSGDQGDKAEKKEDTKQPKDGDAAAKAGGSGSQPSLAKKSSSSRSNLDAADKKADSGSKKASAVSSKKPTASSNERLDGGKPRAGSKSDLSTNVKKTAGGTKAPSKLQQELGKEQQRGSMTQLTPAAAPNEPAKKPRQQQQQQHAQDSAVPELGAGNPVPTATAAPSTATTASASSARPMTAKPPPPKPKRQESSVEPGTGMPPISTFNQSVMSTKEEEDDDDDLIIVQGQTAANETADASSILLKAGANSTTMTAADNNSDQQQLHGGLVRKILETNQQLGNQKQSPNDPNNITADAYQQALSNTTRVKERAATKKETDAIREQVQSICRAVAPFGKLFDYYQEDMDAMQRELSGWKEEAKRHSSVLTEETKETNRMLEPLEKQIQQLDEQIAAQSGKIHEMRAKVLQNDLTIHKLLENIVGPVPVACLR